MRRRFMVVAGPVEGLLVRTLRERASFGRLRLLLVNLLPGLRDLRAPLSAGYIWLLALYLAFEPMLPASSDATGIWQSLVTLRPVMSDVGLAVAVSFLAYLVGSLSEAMRNFVVLLARELVEWPATDSAIDERLRAATISPAPPSTLMFRAYRPYSARSSAALSDLVAARLDLLDDQLDHLSTSLTNELSRAYHGAMRPDSPTHILARGLPGWAESEDLIATVLPQPARADFEPDAARVREETQRFVIHQIADELQLIRTNLIGEEPELWSAIDRQLSEGEFRFALALPLLGLAIALGYRATWLWAVGAVVALVVLVVQGLDSSRQSKDGLIEALRLGRAKSPALERFDLMIEALKGSAMLARE